MEYHVLSSDNASFMTIIKSEVKFIYHIYRYLTDHFREPIIPLSRWVVIVVTAAIGVIIILRWQSMSERKRRRSKVWSRKHNDQREKKTDSAKLSVATGTPDNHRSRSNEIDEAIT